MLTKPKTETTSLAWAFRCHYKRRGDDNIEFDSKLHDCEHLIVAASYFFDDETHVFALNPFTGEQIWRHWARYNLRGAIEVFSGSTAFTVGNRLTVLNQVSGNERWSTTQINSAPTHQNGIVYVGHSSAHNDRHYILALNAHDGREITRFSMHYRMQFKPTLTADHLLFGDRLGWFYHLNANGLIVRHRQRLGDRFISSIHISDSVCYFAIAKQQDDPNQGRYLCAYDIQHRQMLWQREIFALAEDAITVGSGLVFACSTSSLGSLMAIDGRTGNVCWVISAGGSVHCAPVLHQGLLYVSAFRSLLVIEPSTGKVLGCINRSNRIGSTPIIFKGMALFGDQSGEFVSMPLQLNTASHYAGLGIGRLQNGVFEGKLPVP